LQGRHHAPPPLPGQKNNSYLFVIKILIRGRDSSVGTETCYELDGRGSILGRGKEFSSTVLGPDRLWGPINNLLSNGYRGVLSPGVKRPRCEADHSPTPSAEVKNVGAIPPFPHTYSWRGA
jgi:hypothetical protein